MFRFLFCFLFLLPVISGAAELSNVKVIQNGTKVIFMFDLLGEKPQLVELSVTVFGRIYAQNELHLTGDYGRVVNGNEKKIVWDMLKDFPRGVSGALKWELITGSELASEKGLERVFDGVVWRLVPDVNRVPFGYAREICESLSQKGERGFRLPTSYEIEGLYKKIKGSKDISFFGSKEYMTSELTNRSYPAVFSFSLGAITGDGYTGYIVCVCD